MGHGYTNGRGREPASRHFRFTSYTSRFLLARIGETERDFLSAPRDSRRRRRASIAVRKGTMAAVNAKATGDKKGKATPKKGSIVKRKRTNKPGQVRNYDLGNGVYRFSRSRMYKKRALYMKIKKGQRPKPKTKRPSMFVKKPIGGEKNGGERLVRVKKQPRYYPTEPKPRKSKVTKNNFANHTRHLRKSITPGTVLIIVAGKHRGKRVVFLKQLKTGLLLVTGPFKLNRCPLRRINQIYVIATKTKLDFSKVKVPEHLDDKYFKRSRPRRPKKDEGEIFETKKETYRVTDERKKDQIEVDKQVLAAVRSSPEKKFLFAYLGSMFCLRNHMYPHKMRF